MDGDELGIGRLGRDDTRRNERNEIVNEISPLDDPISIPLQCTGILIVVGLDTPFTFPNKINISKIYFES